MYSNIFLKFNFIFSLVGTLGSLYFSEIMLFAPCTLCWYQRVCLYPLLVIFTVALLLEDKFYKKYVYPFLIIGISIALYHNLLYYGFISADLTPCKEGGVSCTSKQLELFGFITIPLLSLLGFTSILLMTFLDNFTNSDRSLL